MYINMVQGSLLIGVALLISAISTIFSKKIENSIFSMIATFAFSGLLFIVIGVPFFGFIYLIVYTAAISILFLFVLMMLKIQDKSGTNLRGPFNPIRSGGNNQYLLDDKFILFSGLISSLLLYLLYGDRYEGWYGQVETSLHYHNEWTSGLILNMDTMQSLAYVLYTEQVSLLILISIVLLIVMVGIINHLSQK